MNFTKSIKQAIEILKLNKPVTEKVAKDKQATTTGILILIIGGLIAGIARKDLILIGITPIISLIFSFIGIRILHLVAKLFKGKAEFIELYRVLTHASILNWLSIFNLIPFVRTIIAVITFVWGIVVNFEVIKNLYKLSTLKTVFVILIPIIFFTVLAIFGAVVYLVLNPEMLVAFQ